MHKRLTELSEYLTTTRSGLFHAVADLSTEIANRRPEPEAWSVAEIMDHLCRVERGTLILLKRLIQQARTAGVGEENSNESVLSTLDSFHVVDSLERVKAPERVVPTPNIPVCESIEKLKQSRLDLLEVFEEGDGLALSEVCYDHPFLGKLNAYQWILVLGQHEARHRRQIQNTKNLLASGSPP